MRNIRIFVFLLILIITFSPSCSREKAKIVEPDEVVVLFMDDTIKGDFQSAYNYIETADKGQGGIGKFVSEADSMLKVVDYEIVSVKQDKFLAEVKINLTTEYEGKRKTVTDVIITLVKEEDDWKIDYWPGP
ncbi:MAG: hypothetical protein M1371_10520 [Actinobacteria bacterium]|nr:hypothetical protein [Actinomycetota bacterium]